MGGRRNIINHLERFYLQTLLDNITELKIVRKLVQIFKTMLARDIEALENGINLAEAMEQ